MHYLPLARIRFYFFIYFPFLAQKQCGMDKLSLIRDSRCKSRRAKRSDLSAVLSDSGDVSIAQPPDIALKMPCLPLWRRYHSFYFAREFDTREFCNTEEVQVPVDKSDTESLLRAIAAADRVEVSVRRDCQSFPHGRVAVSLPVFEDRWFRSVIRIRYANRSCAQDLFLRSDDLFPQGPEREYWLNDRAGSVEAADSTV